jgi:hypothetical protein
VIRRSLKSLVAVSLGVLLASVIAQAGQSSAALSGPILGYVWNQSDRTIRPLQGILGNATIGQPLDLSVALSQVVSLDGRHFVALAENGARLLSISLESGSLESGQPLITEIPDAPTDFSAAAGSRRGSAAALYYGQQRGILVVTGLPSAPKVQYGIEIAGFGESVTHLAVSDDGAQLLFSVPGEERQSVYGWTPASGVRALTSAGAVSNIAFAANGNAIVADAKANEVFAIVDPGGSAIREFLADERTGISRPVGLIVSNSNEIYVANAGSATIMVLDSAGLVLRTDSCGCDLAGLYPLRDSIYRLSNGVDRTIYLLEARPTGDRVAFVPALHANN